ncbi:Porin D precursor [compost metagenome]
MITEGTLSSEFLNPKERSWQVKYDYDFVGVGIPGLKGMLRYVSGDNIDLPKLGGDKLKESEKDMELSYVIQTGTFKDVAFRVRHAWYRNDFGPGATQRDDNELRVNIDYALALW